MLDNNFLKNNIEKIFINLKKKNYFLKKNLFKNLLNFKKKFFKKIIIIEKIEKTYNKILLKKKYFIKIKKFYKNYLNKIDKNLKIFLLKIPNLIHYFIFKKNRIVKKVFYKLNKKEFNRKFNFNSNIGNIISGKGFCFITSPISILYNKIENYILELHIKEHNYKYIIVPEIVGFISMINSGQIPKFIKKLFVLKLKDKIKYLIPTSEVSLVNFMSNKIIKSKYIPLKFMSNTDCFRNENISYGKKNKSIIRQKQFKKIELVQFIDNKNSYRYLIELIKNVEKILKNLKINYRIIDLSLKNLGYVSVKTYDIEI